MGSEDGGIHLEASAAFRRILESLLQQHDAWQGCFDRGLIIKLLLDQLCLKHQADEALDVRPSVEKSASHCKTSYYKPAC